MARQFNSGQTQAQALGFTPLSAYAGAFTVVGWFKPDNLTQSVHNVLREEASASVRWAVRWEATSNALDFVASSSGTSLDTGTAITLDAGHVARGAWFAYRYQGAGLEWSSWLDGTKTVINAAIDSGTMSTFTNFYVGYASAVGVLDGAIAEVSIWKLALEDEEIVALHNGRPARLIRPSTSRSVYWPMLGDDDPEPDHFAWPSSTGGTTLDPGTATKATQHPRRVYTLDRSEPAWCVDLTVGGETIRAASTDLTDAADVAILGAPYPRRLRGVESIAVRETLPAVGGIIEPGTVTVTLDNTDAKLPTEVDGLLAWYTPRTLTVIDGDAIATWADASENGNDATQGTAANQPTRQQANGTDVVRFDGTNDALDLPASFTSGDYSIVGALTLGELLGSSDVILGDGVAWELGFNAAEQLYWTDGTNTLTDSTARVADEWVVFSLVVGGGVASLTINGALAGLITPPATPGNPTTTLTLSGDPDVGQLAFFSEGISHEDRRAIEQTMATAYGVDYPGNPDPIDASREWRNVPAVLRRYDRAAYELTSELSGVVVGVVFAGHRVVLTIGSQASNALSTLVPTKVVDVDTYTTATDLNAPIPVVAGRAFVSAPYIARDDSGDPGGRTFVVSHTEDKDGGSMVPEVVGVYMDVDRSSPGLEKAFGWYVGPGTIAYHDADEFDVGSDLSDAYDYAAANNAGMPARVKCNGASEWTYSHVIDYDSGNDRVKLADAVLSDPVDEVEILGDYLVERGVLTSDSTDLVTVRFPVAEVASVVVDVDNTDDLSNPADVIGEILANSVWGLGETIDATSFTDAAADYTAASLGTLNGAIGGRRQQRTARDVLGEILALRGGRLWKDAGAGAWKLAVDVQPATADQTFGYNDGVFNNIKQVISYGGASVDDAVKTLVLRYDGGGRATSNSDPDVYAPGEGDYSVKAEVLPFGAERVVVSPWITTEAVAAEVLNYWSRRMRLADRSLVIRVGLEGRGLTLGQLVTIDIPHLGLARPMRVVGIARRIADSTVTLEGYDAAIYTAAAAGDVYYEDSTSPTAGDGGATTSTDAKDIDQRRSYSGARGNALYNSDCSIPVREYNLSADSLPGWEITTPGNVASITTTASPRAMGHRTLDIALSSISTPPVFRSTELDSSTIRAMSVRAGDPVIASVYCDSETGWYFQVEWRTVLGATISTDDLVLRVDPDDLNGEGYRRCYSFARAPATAALAVLRFTFSVKATYKYDAFQFEVVGRGVWKPTQYSRNPTWSVHPRAIEAGDFTVRASGEPEAGFRFGHESVVETVGTGSTYTTTATPITSGRAILGVSGYFNGALGPTTLSVGLSSNATRYAALINGASGTTFDSISHATTTGNSFAPGERLLSQNLGLASGYSASESIVLSKLSGSNFNGTGEIHLLVSYIELVAPTS